MAALPTDFLRKVIAEVATLKNIVDAQKVVKETDATVTACAKIAYIQICRFCRRPFHWGARTEYFDYYTGPTLFRTIPLDRTQPIQVIQDGVEVTTDNYKIVRNSLVLYNDTVDSVGNPRYPNIEFSSTAGIKLIEDNNTLYTAVMMQTIANYHRRDTYGLSETSGEKGVARTPADSGEIIESVKQLLDELMYNGTGYTVDGE
jgi:hypothetical protein